MRFPSWFTQKGYYLGPFAAVYAWVVILVCARLNPWWNWTASYQGAFSYMGDPTLTPYAWIYDYMGMVPTGLMISLFAVYLLAISRNRTERMGSASFSFAGILLVLIGVFHQTPGHLEVLHVAFSAWFFLQSLVSVLIWGIGLHHEDRRPLGLGMIALALGAILFDGIISLAFGSPSDQSLRVWGYFLLGFGAFIFPFGTWAVLGGVPGKRRFILGALPLLVGAALLALFAGAGKALIGSPPQPLGTDVGVVLFVTGALMLVAHVQAPLEGVRGKAGTLMGFVALVLGVLSFFVGTLAVGGPPGAVGEVLGILAVDAWVGILYFARRNAPWEPVTPLFPGILQEGESLRAHARPALAHVLQIRAILSVGLGLLLFGYGNYYLVSHLSSILLSVSTKNAEPVILEVLLITLGTSVAGYLMVVYGSWRWSATLPAPVAFPLFFAVALLPVISFFAWFAGTGNEVLLVYFLILALLVPLLLSLVRGWRTHYGFTDQRVLSTQNPDGRSPTILPADSVSGVSVDQGWLQELAGYGDIQFHDVHDPGSLGGENLTWKGIPQPREMLKRVQTAANYPEVPYARPPRRVLPFLLLFAVSVVVLLVLTLVPVYSVTNTADLNCALYLNLQSLEANPWPFLHNISIPPGQVTFQWWSGTPVWVVVLELGLNVGATKGIAYENTVPDSLIPTNQANLTSSGTGGYTSYGGPSIAGCVATTTGATVSLELHYSAPLVWV